MIYIIPYGGGEASLPPYKRPQSGKAYFLKKDTATSYKLNSCSTVMLNFTLDSCCCYPPHQVTACPHSVLFETEYEWLKEMCFWLVTGHLSVKNRDVDSH